LLLLDLFVRPRLKLEILHLLFKTLRNVALVLSVYFMFVNYLVWVVS